jgi:ATP-dependent DNA helicase PIF1
LAATLRLEGRIVLCVASSGCAAELLTGGRTAHSTFKLPIPTLEDSICNIVKQSTYADMMREVSLIIWDEVSMQHRHCSETANRSLQDIRNDLQTLFGGIMVVFGGDFRQILPVVLKGFRKQIVDASLLKVFVVDKHIGLAFD